MRRLVYAIAFGALVASPSMAQTYRQPVVQRDTVPVQISQDQIMTLQRTLKTKGYSAGPVDGLWGPKTTDALKRFQAKNNLNPTGELDRTTELKLGMVKPANEMVTPVAAPPVQAPNAAANTTSPSAAGMPALPATPPAAVVLTPVTPAPTGAAGSKQPKPTAGANSFTQDQARERIGSNGFGDVRDLALDNRGIWRGMATKEGRTVHVWLDYQGDVGQD